MGLTEKQRKNCEDCFKKFDVNGDGSLSIQEMVKLFREIGYSPKQLSDQEICRLFLDADTSGDSKVSLQEFVTICDKRPTKETNEANLRATFKHFDKDGSGNISASELKKALAECEIQISSEDADKMIKEADTSGDGQLNVEEFLAVFKK